MNKAGKSRLVCFDRVNNKNSLMNNHNMNLDNRLFSPDSVWYTDMNIGRHNFRFHQILSHWDSCSFHRSDLIRTRISSNLLTRRIHSLAGN